MGNRVLFVGGPLHGRVIRSDLPYFKQPIPGPVPVIYSGPDAMVRRNLPPMYPKCEVFTYRRQVLVHPIVESELVFYVPEEVPEQGAADFILWALALSAFAAFERKKEE